MLIKKFLLNPLHLNLESQELEDAATVVIILCTCSVTGGKGESSKSIWKPSIGYEVLLNAGLNNAILLSIS